MKAIFKIMAIFFIIGILYLSASVKTSPAAYRPANKSGNGLNDDNYNYGCGFHIVFNSTLY